MHAQRRCRPRRLYPGTDVHLEEEDIHISYDEDASLESTNEES